MAVFRNCDMRCPVSFDSVAFRGRSGSSFLSLHGEIIIVNSSMF